jgi:hypothetical protein
VRRGRVERFGIEGIHACKMLPLRGGLCLLDQGDCSALFLIASFIRSHPAR